MAAFDRASQVYTMLVSSVGFGPLRQVLGVSTGTDILERALAQRQMKSVLEHCCATVGRLDLMYVQGHGRILKTEC